MSTTDPVSSHRGNKYGVQKVLPLSSEMTQISPSTDASFLGRWKHTEDTVK
jgi:hypothetical protein